MRKFLLDNKRLFLSVVFFIAVSVGGAFYANTLIVEKDKTIDKQEKILKANEVKIQELKKKADDLEFQTNKLDSTVKEKEDIIVDLHTNLEMFGAKFSELQGKYDELEGKVNGIK